MEFFSKCDQIRSFLRIWSHLLKKSLMENFNFCAVMVASKECQQLPIISEIINGEAAVLKCSWKYLFLKISQYSQEKRLQHSCFSMNIAKFLRTPLRVEHTWWLLLLMEMVRYHLMRCNCKPDYFLCLSAVQFALALFYVVELNQTD